jgi:hypothetical protein
MNGLRALLIVPIVLCQAACTAAPIPPPAAGEVLSSDLIQVEPWPEADALFRSDPKWLGSDGAYSIDLGDGRVLWLFGDTFISTSILNTRRVSKMIRNSVGIQTGYDPSAAAMAFTWRTEGGKPSSFFPEDGETWFWPGHGIALDDRLIVFLVATRATSEGLGFEHIGWRAVSISHPEQPPSEWRLKWLDTPQNRFGLIVSGSVIRLGEHIYAFSVLEPDHTIHVVTWPVAEVMDGDLSRPQWWAGEEGGWVLQRDLLERPSPLFSEGQNEFTVHYEPLLDQLLEIQTVGFGQADLGFRRADSPTGPWTPVERFYRPEEWETARILIYAAKAHPHLTGADLVLTYATNSVPFARLVRRDDLYYPRFLRARLEDARGAMGLPSNGRRRTTDEGQWTKDDGRRTMDGGREFRRRRGATQLPINGRRRTKDDGRRT